MDQNADVRHGGKREGAGRKPLGGGKKKRTVALALPPDLVEQIDAFAGKNTISRSQAAVMLLRAGLAK